MQADLAGGTGNDLPSEVRADVDLYLTVARRLLGDTAATPIAGASASEVSTLVAAAHAATGIERSRSSATTV